MLQGPKYYARFLFVPILLEAACFGQPAEGVSRPDAAPAAPTAILSGVTKGPEGKPLAGAQVVIHNLDDGTERVLETDTAGQFAATDLKPGRYRLTTRRRTITARATASSRWPAT
jgi:hypothetical protein